MMHSLSGFCVNRYYKTNNGYLNPVLLGSAVATHLGKGFLAIRKAGHLCVETQTEKYIDYSGRDKLLEVRVDVLKPGTEIQHTTG